MQRRVQEFRRTSGYGVTVELQIVHGVAPTPSRDSRFGAFDIGLHSIGIREMHTCRSARVVGGRLKVVVSVTSVAISRITVDVLLSPVILSTKGLDPSGPCGGCGSQAEESSQKGARGGVWWFLVEISWQ